MVDESSVSFSVRSDAFSFFLNRVLGSFLKLLRVGGGPEPFDEVVSYLVPGKDMTDLLFVDGIPGGGFSSEIHGEVSVDDGVRIPVVNVAQILELFCPGFWILHGSIVVGFSTVLPEVSLHHSD